MKTIYPEKYIPLLGGPVSIEETQQWKFDTFVTKNKYQGPIMHRIH